MRLSPPAVYFIQTGCSVLSDTHNTFIYYAEQSPIKTAIKHLKIKGVLSVAEMYYYHLPNIANHGPWLINDHIICIPIEIDVT